MWGRTATASTRAVAVEARRSNSRAAARQQQARAMIMKLGGSGSGGDTKHAHPHTRVHSHRPGPVLLLDVMDTLIQDPFFEHMPRYFGLTFKELMASKHPTAWVEFEKGLIDEAELFSKFFSDGRKFDGDGLVQHMIQHYQVRSG